MEKKHKTVLIFGVSGQDGSLLANFLINKGYKVHGTSRNTEVADFNSLKKLNILQKLKLHSIKLTDFKSISNLINDVQPDEIYNLSGQSSVGESFQKPIETFNSIAIVSINILEAIRASKSAIRFYSACSSECFGDTKGIAADEYTAFNPQSPYAISKATAFWQVSNYRKNYKLYVCSGILFNHESPFRSEKFVTRKIISSAVRIKLGSKEKVLLGDLSIKRDWGWAPEYVEAMWLMLQQKFPDDFVIASGESNSLENFVKITFDKLGLNWQDHVEIDKKLFRSLDIRQSFANVSKANKNLQWFASTKMKEVISKMIKADLELFSKFNL